jgi:uncharacterized protein
MKVLAFSDLHSDETAALKLVEKSAWADVTICAGDLCNAHQHLERMIQILKTITTPTILVAGNNETTDNLLAATAAVPNFQVLHNSGTEIDGLPFWGIGGGIPTTPFGSWSYDFTEQQAEILLSACPLGGILVTHSPPFGVLDRSSRGGNLGSRAIRSTIERCRPKLAVSGHIHASGGKQMMMDGTLVLNAGPLGICWEG